MHLQLQLGHEWSLDELPPRTIALDGAVAGPYLDPGRQVYSFDHHHGCLRMITRASCEQVFDALLLGLDPTGHRVLLNDIDGDTLLSVWLLLHHPWWRDPAEVQRVRPLVIAVGAADAHGPAYPGPDPVLVGTYHGQVVTVATTLARQAGADASAALKRGIEAMDAWWHAGLPLDPPPVRPSAPALQTVDYGGWVLATAQPEDHADPRAGVRALYGQGCTRVLLHTPGADGHHHYTLARRSDLVAGFPLPELYERLNTREEKVRGAGLAPGQTWGGGSSIGGGPRAGSVLAPADVAAVIVAALAAGSPS